jgi:hypothetical protein
MSTLRLDPARWPHRVHVATLIAATVVTFAVGLAPSPWWHLASLGLPLGGALIWKFDRVRVRDIALLTLPFAACLIALELQPYFIVRVAGYVAAVLLLAAMMFSDLFRSRWLAFVAPGHYRVLTGEDRRLYDKAMSFREQAWKAIRSFRRPSDFGRLNAMLAAIREKAAAPGSFDQAWAEVQAELIGWLDALRDALVAMPDETEQALSRLLQRQVALADTVRRTTAAREVPLQ